MYKFIPALLAISSIALAADTAPTPTVSLRLALIDVNEGRVESHCEEKTGAYNFQVDRLRAKNKAGTQTWEDIANYQTTRGNLFECISNDQKGAIKTERVSANIVIGALNESLDVVYGVNASIDKVQQEFRLCDKLPVPAERAVKTCGAQAFIYECARHVAQRSFVKESAREGGPWGHVLMAVSANAMTRQINLMQCVIDNLAPVEDKSGIVHTQGTKI